MRVGRWQWWGTVAAVAATAAAAGPAGPAQRPRVDGAGGVRSLTIRYRSHAGRIREAVVLVPRSYDRRSRPALPLVISPHGRGGTGAGNAALWGELPAQGRFVVVNPDGDGNRLRR